MQNRATNAFARLKSLAFKQPSFGQVFYKYLELTEITSQGELVFTLKLTQEHCDYSGRFHTGAISALLDGSTTLSAWSLIEENKMTLSVDMSLSFIESAFVDDRITIKAKCDKILNNMAYTHGYIYKDDTIIASVLHNIILLNRNINS